MPFLIQKTDILSFSGDAVVNPTDEFFSGGGGLDAQLRFAAGPLLRRDCAGQKPPGIGEAVITGAGDLRCRFVIHTSAPVWSGTARDTEQLRSCYRSALALADSYGLTELAFPLIGSGARGFPKELVLRVAAEEIGAFLADHADTFVLLAIHDKSCFQPDVKLLRGLEEYLLNIDRAERLDDMLKNASTAPFPAFSISDAPLGRDRAEQAPALPEESRRENKARGKRFPGFSLPRRSEETDARPDGGIPVQSALRPCSAFEPERDAILDESFSEMVMRKIDERGFKKDSDCYTRANIDRRLFSRIRCDAHYHPKKTTALALAVALELSLEETNELLLKAGYSLSHSILSDLIVEYCIRERRYDIFEVNELLFRYDQALLGG